MAEPQPRAGKGQARMRISIAFSILVAALALVAGTLTFAFELSGALRAATGQPIQSCMQITVLLTALVLAGGFNLLSVQRFVSPAWNIAAPLFLLSAIFFSLRLYYPAFDGLVSVGGGDAGSHAYFQGQFLTTDPAAYHSFAAFSALTYWLQEIGKLSTFESFRAAYYDLVMLILLLIFFLAATVADDAKFRRTGTTISFFSLFALLAYFPAERILMPILHYFQADGFYPQLAGLLPMLAVWIISTVVENLYARLVALAAALTMTRFTYGLNLPDLLLAVSASLILERVQSRGSIERAVGLCAGVALAAAAFVAFPQLFSIFGMEGSILKTNMKAIAAGQAIIACILMLAARGFFAPIHAGSVQRAYIFPACFSAVGICVSVYFGTSNPLYYSYKHIVASSFFAVVAICICVAHVVTAQLYDNRKLTPRTLTLLCGALLGLWSLKLGYEVYQPSYRERAEHKENPELLVPLADLQAWKIIESTLKEKDRAFGGFITPSWPVSNFMNASFGYFGELPFYRSGIPPKINHSCLFWSSDPLSLAEYNRAEKSTAGIEVEKLSGSDGARRISYKRSSDQTDRELSFSCTAE